MQVLQHEDDNLIYSKRCHAPEKPTALKMISYLFAEGIIISTTFNSSGTGDRLRTCGNTELQEDRGTWHGSGCHMT